MENKPTVKFKSKSPHGNIYGILGQVRETLRKENRITDWNNCYERVTNGTSYVEAIGIIREYVNLIDEDKKF